MVSETQSNSLAVITSVDCFKGTGKEKMLSLDLFNQPDSLPLHSEIFKPMRGLTKGFSEEPGI